MEDVELIYCEQISVIVQEIQTHFSGFLKTQAALFFEKFTRAQKYFTQMPFVTIYILDTTITTSDGALFFSS